MELLHINLVLFFASVAFASEIQKIEGVEGPIQLIEFDRDFNIYIASNEVSNATFYKLSSSKELVLKKRNLNGIEKIFVTNSNDVYIFDNDTSWFCQNLNDCKLDKEVIYFLKRNSTLIEQIHEHHLESIKHVHFKDKNGNIFFNTKNGVAFLKSGSRIPAAIYGLEYFHIREYPNYAADFNDGVYLVGSFKDSSTEQIAQIFTAYVSALSPSGKVFDSPSPHLDYLSDLVVDNNRNLFVAFGGDQARIYLNVLSDYSSDVVLSQHSQSYEKFFVVGLRTYFFSLNLYTFECYLNYFNTDWNFVRFPHYLLYNWWINTLISSDSVGNLYFAYQHQILFLGKYETFFKSIILPVQNLSSPFISSIETDQNDNLWILKGDLYVVRNGTVEARQIDGTACASDEGLLKINKITNEIFIGCSNGLYVYSY